MYLKISLVAIKILRAGALSREALRQELNEWSPGQSRQHVLLEHRGGRQNDVLDILDTVGLVNLLEQLRIADLDNLVKVRETSVRTVLISKDQCHWHSRQ